MPRIERFVIGRQRSDVSAFADRFERWCDEQSVPAETMLAFQVAFDELLTNALDHGLAAGPDPRLELQLARDDDGVSAELVDNGVAFDPFADIAPPDLDSALDQRAIGGLGVHLVRNLMDTVRYERRDGHNHIFLSRRFRPPG